MVKAQTIKQAKAAFKARNYNPLSEREKRQMDRSIELDKRAWRTKEQEKRKAEAILKRKEKERHDREEQMCTRLGEQRKCDKFGYESSQFHLGAFFGKAKTAQIAHITPQRMQACNDDHDHTFDDELVDDDSLFEALNTTTVSPQPQRILPHTRPDPGNGILFSRSDSGLAQQPNELCPRHDEDLDSFLDELGSSTQIAREIQDASPSNGIKDDYNASSGSGSSGFDFSLEDMEALEASILIAQKEKDDRKLMPPPGLTTKVATAPRRRAPYMANGFTQCRDVSRQHQASLDRTTEFTMSQLETYVDDDLQLTQAAPT